MDRYVIVVDYPYDASVIADDLPHVEAGESAKLFWFDEGVDYVTFVGVEEQAAADPFGFLESPFRCNRDLSRSRIGDECHRLDALRIERFIQHR